MCVMAWVHAHSASFETRGEVPPPKSYPKRDTNQNCLSKVHAFDFSFTRPVLSSAGFVTVEGERDRALFVNV